MSVRFRLLTEADVKAVLTMEDLVEAMQSALRRFSERQVEQPVRTVIMAGGYARRIEDSVEIHANTLLVARALESPIISPCP